MRVNASHSELFITWVYNSRTSKTLYQACITDKFQVSSEFNSWIRRKPWIYLLFCTEMCYKSPVFLLSRTTRNCKCFLYSIETSYFIDKNANFYNLHICKWQVCTHDQFIIVNIYYYIFTRKTTDNDLSYFFCHQCVYVSYKRQNSSSTYDWESVYKGRQYVLHVNV